MLPYMKIKHLTQLREMLSKALSGQTNLSKSFQSFFIETMELILTHKGRLNFTQMAKCGRSCESRFRQNFKKAFDWFKFNKSFLESAKEHRIASQYVRTGYLRRLLDKVSAGVRLCDAKQFTGLTHCQARNKEALSFAFNASLTSVNAAMSFARQHGMDLSGGSTKTLLHNAEMLDRFIAMSWKSPNMRLNNTDFKELLFYGVRAVS